MSTATIIYKYPLPMVGNVIELPVGSQVLDVAFQDDELCLWARVPQGDTITSRRRFLVMPTGMPLPTGDETHTYIGTAHHASGRLVFHVFEIE